MRKFLALPVAVTALAAALTLGTGTALAGGCATHTVNNVVYAQHNDGTDHLTANADFDCGNGGLQYRVKDIAQYKVNGVWTDEPLCGCGPLVAQTWPSPTTWFGAGTEHNMFWDLDVASSAGSCSDPGNNYRFRYVVTFKDGSSPVTANTAACA